MAKPHILGTGHTGVHGRFSETQVQGRLPKGHIMVPIPMAELEFAGDKLTIVLGSKCCLETIITTVKDTEHVSKGFYADSLTTTV